MEAVWFHYVVLIIVATSSCTHADLRIGSWNIQNFGKTKAQKPEILRTIATVIGLYDVVAIQELQNRDRKAIQALFRQVMRQYPEENYKIIISPDVGDGGYREQYAVIYRSDLIHAETVGVYDGKRDFNRPPFFVLLQSSFIEGIEEFGLGVIHTSPTRAVEEVDALADAMDWFREQTSVPDLLMMGDFNSACDYVKENDWENIELFTRDEFTWHIEDSVDTTVGDSDCAYDRIVSVGSGIKKVLKKGSAKALDIARRLSLSLETVTKISDHLPVEITVKSKSSVNFVDRNEL